MATATEKRGGAASDEAARAARGSLDVREQDLHSEANNLQEELNVDIPGVFLDNDFLRRTDAGGAAQGYCSIHRCDLEQIDENRRVWILRQGDTQQRYKNCIYRIDKTSETAGTLQKTRSS